jgi:hypothetical protein
MSAGFLTAETSFSYQSQPDREFKTYSISYGH